MHDRLEPRERRRIADDALGKTRAIDRAVDGHARKCRFDRRDRRAAIEAVHGGVRIVNRHAAAREHFRGRALARGDRSGEADDAHVSVSP